MPHRLTIVPEGRLPAGYTGASHPNHWWSAAGAQSCTATARMAGTADNRWMNWMLTGAAALLMVGCSPALNWRTVPLPEAAITATLPCKADHATRSVELAGTPVELSMVGCDADGSTFAVSHAPLADPAQLAASLRHWRAAMLARLGPQAAATAVDAPHHPKGTMPVPEAVHTVATGVRPDGTPVHAEAVWFARATGDQIWLVHAVVYSDRPRPEVAGTFFSGLVLQP